MICEGFVFWSIAIAGYGWVGAQGAGVFEYGYKKVKIAFVSLPPAEYLSTVWYFDVCSAWSEDYCAFLL